MDKENDLAWIQINLKNLEYNLQEIQKNVSRKTKIMAVVKANAYGHDLVLISKKLNELNIFDFAVSSLNEAIELRKNNIVGNILILGYTDYKDLELVNKYDLIQTIIDYQYAKNLENLNLKQKLKVHLKINTGMNRIGEDYQNIDNLKKMFLNKNIEILGIYTHLSVSDSLLLEDINFTKRQINNFFKVIKALKDAGYTNFLTHIQSSYGLLNYNELELDYVRIGLLLYGVNSYFNIKTKIKLNLKPVLSLKAKIISIKTLKVHESIGYGRIYTTTSKTKIATIMLGYSSGYPRCLEAKSFVLINNQKCPIVGRICMNQLMIDISNINAKIGDVVTLIGEDDFINASYLAKLANTTSYELLARLSLNLKRIIKK